MATTEFTHTFTSKNERVKSLTRLWVSNWSIVCYSDSSKFKTMLEK